MVSRWLSAASGAALLLTLTAPAAAASPISAVAAVTGASSRPSADEVDWRQFHGRPNHRGINRSEKLVDNTNVSNLSLSWIGNGATQGAELVFKSSPTVVDGVVYFGTDGGQLLAFADDCAGPTCDPVWRVDLPQGIFNTPAVIDGVLYVGTASVEGWLYAFDVDACAAGSCTPLWQGDVGVGESSPTVAKGTVYVGSQFDGVYAFDAEGCGAATCDPLWVGETSGYVINSPAVAKGVVYAGDSDGIFYAFDADGCGAASCAPLWTGQVSGPIYASSPAVRKRNVYVASFAAAPRSDLNVFAAAGCGAAECQPLWRGTGGHYLNSSPAIAYGNVYIGSGDGTLQVWPASGCGASTCPASWVGDAAGGVATSESAPMLANGVVYIGENTGRVLAFPASGCGRALCDELWQFLTQDPIVNSSPTMVNGTLYVSGTNFGTVPELYVFDLVT